MSDAVFSNPIRDCVTCPLGSASRHRCPFTPTHLEAGAVLCGQGETPTAVGFIREGLMILSSAGTDGSEQGIALRGPGALLCTEALRAGPCLREIRALTEVRLCALSTAAFERWLGPERSPARAIVELALDEIGWQHDELRWHTGRCTSRLARFLLATCSAGKTHARLSKRVISQALGMRPETLSRCLHRLGEAGLLDSARGVLVLDAPGLAALAEADAEPVPVPPPAPFRRPLKRPA